jgi:hypothetical protein
MFAQIEESFAMGMKSMNEAQTLKEQVYLTELKELKTHIQHLENKIDNLSLQLVSGSSIATSTADVVKEVTDPLKLLEEVYLFCMADGRRCKNKIVGRPHLWIDY